MEISALREQPGRTRYLNNIPMSRDGEADSNFAIFSESKVRKGEIEETIECFRLPFEEIRCDAVSESELH